MNIHININPSDHQNDPTKVADFIVQLNSALHDAGLSTLSDKSTSPKKRTQNDIGPFASKWMELKGTTRIRCTEGRSIEEQAAHNLITYADFSAQDLEALITDESSTCDSDDEHDDEEDITTSSLI